MYRKRRVHGFKDFADDYLSGGIFFFITGLILLGVVTFIVVGAMVADESGSRSDMTKSRTAVAALFQSDNTSASSADYRRVLAGQLLKLDDKQLTDTYPALSKTSLEEVVSTGQPPQLNDLPPQVVWHTFLHILLYWVTWIAALILNVLLVGSLVYESIDNDEQIADLPYRRVWTWLFILLTPVGWPFYIVSYPRFVYYDRQRRAVEAAQRARREETRRYQSTGWLNPPMPPELAMAAYVQLRQTGEAAAYKRAVTSVQSMIDNLQYQVGERDRELDRISTALERDQKDLATSKRRFAELQANPPTSDTSEQAAAQYRAEFTRLMQLPSVKRVEVAGGRVTVLCGPMLAKISGRNYDLGDYLLTVEPGQAHQVQVRCTRISSKTGGSHPYSTGHGICFGTIAGEIEELCRQGEYLPAIMVAIVGMTNVNRYDRDSVRRDYPEVK